MVTRPNRLLAPALAALLLGCPRPVYVLSEIPPPTPVDVAEDEDGLGTELGSVCANLRRIGCPEGYPNRAKRSCFRTLAGVEAEHVEIPSACLKRAEDEGMVRVCGTPSTLRVRCRMPSAEVPSSVLGQ